MATVVENSLYWGNRMAFSTYTTTAGDTVAWPLNTLRSTWYRFEDVDCRAATGTAQRTFSAGGNVAGVLWDPRNKNDAEDHAQVTWDPGTGLIQLLHASNSAADGALIIFEGQPLWHSGYARTGTVPSGTASMAPLLTPPYEDNRFTLNTATTVAAGAEITYKPHKHQVFELSAVAAQTGDTFQVAPGLVAAVVDPKLKSDDTELCNLSWDRTTGVITFQDGNTDTATYYLHVFYGGSTL
jgi:hypothetical protein